MKGWHFAAPFLLADSVHRLLRKAVITALRHKCEHRALWAFDRMQQTAGE
jgi:hypothetical protein